MRKYIFSLFVLFSANAMALAEYDFSEKTITFDTITHNGIDYDDVVIRITGYELVSVGASRPVKDAVCPENFNISQYNHIHVGMTLAKVDDIIGCNFDEDGTETSGDIVTRNWETPGHTLREIFVNFDVKTGLVAPDLSGIFKRKIGF